MSIVNFLSEIFWVTNLVISYKSMKNEIDKKAKQTLLLVKNDENSDLRRL